MEKRTGGCHCGKVRYEVEIDLSKPVIECNCSHCQIKGLLLAFAQGEKLTVISGEDAMTEYRFNTHKIHHTFCKICGVQPFGRALTADGSQGSMINVRTLDDIDLATLPRTPFDGKNK